MHVFLGLGSNLGDRDLNLITARDLLMKNDVLVMGQSSVVETEPLGGLDQPLYLNQVIECQTELPPEELLKICKKVEQEMGRPVAVELGNVQFGKKAGEPRWQSRVIDIDILFYGDMVMHSPLLILPHPGVVDRNFVMDGVLELAPDFVHPGLKKPLKALRAQA
jgi:dihydroneopterin aldolase/2-amino-4-hydroxy-6-hydroxymethyldihydropteridine diphosphokinase